MPKFRKKPVVIEAIQFDPDRWEDALRFGGAISYVPNPGVEYTGGHLLIETLEGTMRGDPGDYIIRGVKGEVYPIKADIFAATYEPVEG